MYSEYVYCRHQTVVMMEMQDTINALQRELSSMQNAQPQPTPQQVYSTKTAVSSNDHCNCVKIRLNRNVFQIPGDAPIMFTRLDSERNAKVMKRALNERRLSQETYEVRNAVIAMCCAFCQIALIFTSANLECTLCFVICRIPSKV